MNVAVVPGSRVRTRRTTTSIMLELFGALMALFIGAMIYYGIKGGNDAGALIVRAITNLAVATCVAFVTEVSFIMVRERKTFFKEVKVANYFYISPLIIVLLFPVYTPVYVIFVATLFGEAIGKMIFGGFGSNIFNPALAGRMFAAVCFGSQLSGATVVNPSTALDVSTGATINSANQAAGWLTDMTGQLGLLDTLLGNYRGALGETFAIVILVLGVYLMVRKVIDYRLTITYILGFYVFALVVGLMGGKGAGSFEYALLQTCYGGVLFGAVFCITDPVTSPVSGTGKVIAALLAALCCGLIRYLGSTPEGVAYSILLMNMCTPLIDKLLSRKTNEKMWAQYTAIGVFGVLIVAASLGTGAQLKKDADSQTPNKEVTMVVEHKEVASNFPCELVVNEVATMEGVAL